MTATLRQKTSVSTNRFTWHKETQTFCADVSDLRDLALSRVWPDSCDVGFALVSEWTGKEETVVMQDERRNDDGDLLYTDFWPVNKKLRFTVRIFND